MNIPGQKVYNLKNALVIIIAFTLCRLIYLYLNHLDLHPDEAQYWFWSRFPNFGYYSKPPVIAWLIAFSTWVAGHDEFGVRWLSPILHMGTAIAIYFTGKQLWDEKVGFFSSLSYLLLPGVTFSASMMTTDTPLLFFWALALLFFCRAEKDNNLKDWILTGIFFGFGVLSKYTMAIFAVSAFFYLLFYRREYLKTYKPWLAFLIGLMLLSPNLIWNYHNGMVSFLHTEDNLNPDLPLFNFIKIFEFTYAQAAILGPVFFIFLLFILIFKARIIKYRQNYRLLAFFFIPLLALTLTVSFLSRAHGNWAAPIYVPISIFITAWLLENNKSSWIRISLIVHLILAAIFFNYSDIRSLLHIRIDPMARMKGWDIFSYQVARIANKYPKTLILTDERKIVAALSYYLRNEKNRPAVVYKWNKTGKPQDHFDLVYDLNDLKGHDLIYVSRNQNEFPDVAAHFKMAVGITKLYLPANPKFLYEVYYMKGFKGY